MSKVHVVLYTCASSRAVSLDLVPDTSSACLTLSLRRHISRWGTPKLWISDNAKCFIGPEVKDFLRNNNCNWEFILERSPWWEVFGSD